MQVDRIGAVAGDAHHHVGVDAIREGDRAAASVVETANREGDGRRLGIVDDMVGGVGDHKRRYLGLVGVECNTVAGGVCRIAYIVRESTRLNSSHQLMSYAVFRLRTN